MNNPNTERYDFDDARTDRNEHLNELVIATGLAIFIAVCVLGYVLTR